MPELIPDEYKPSPDGFDLTPFHRLIQRLRDPRNGCPWDISRTLSTMGKTLREEADEAAEALSSGDAAHQCEELGDVLLNIMLAVVIAEEEGKFTWRDVVEGVSAKLVRRHPHVFGDRRAASPEEAMSMFLAAKADEQKKKGL